ncbi:cupin domain-containing protein [Bdellovibrio sp. SKB1291214]|uniref:JmjC domain-containing protein n=1 Tax=Bdellovibrio sp. SKB1291214 TaxID=1732569 RepID=UPI00223FBA0C|nr:cupin domain-containing protein [Bdellovibrio sp. SKB1291214]UYL07860.1 cupin domain-containing protein [Bdellovibrio sp. SKB1291214]
MNLLNKMIAPMTLNEFNCDYLLQKPYSAASCAQDIRNVFNWSVAMEIVNSQYDKTFLAKNGKVITEHNPLCADSVCKGLTQGATLIIPHAELAHPTFKKLAGHFLHHYPRPYDVELYLTPEGNEGLDWHYDYEDVFVMQSSGVKEFTLRKNSFWPMAADRRISQKEVWIKEHFLNETKCTLHPGDWLYIPAGYWHKAKALTQSYHISVGLSFDRPTFELSHAVYR